ncbi:MAG TPA: four helix bundle protein [Thermoanaerobaculia bacterium]
MDFAQEIYQQTKDFPADERFGLIAQMRRSAVSIPSNIAEGQGRITTGEWIQFVGQARGSLYELQTHILVAERPAPRCFDEQSR